MSGSSRAAHVEDPQFGRMDPVKIGARTPLRMFDENMDTKARDRQRRRPIRLTAAAAVPLAVCAALVPFRDSLTSATNALIVVIVVVAFASTGDRAAGLVAALSGGLWFDFFLTSPYLSFTINDPDDVEVAVLLVLVGAAVTEIALWGRREQARASRTAGYLDGMQRVAAIATRGQPSPTALTDVVSDEIVHVLGIDRARFVPVSDLDPRTPRLDHDGEISRAGRRLDVSREGLPSDDEIALEVRRNDAVLGYFMLTASTRVARPTAEQRKVAVLLADQVGADAPAAPTESSVAPRLPRL